MSFFEIVLVLLAVGLMMGAVSWVAAAKRSSDFEPEKERLLQELNSVSRQILEKNTPVLAKKRLQLIHLDDYGVKCGTEAWRKEFEYFYNTVLLQNPDYISASSKLNSGLIGVGRIENYEINKEALWIGINTKIDAFIEENPLILPMEKISGGEFEVFCAEALSADGGI